MQRGVDRRNEGNVLYGRCGLPPLAGARIGQETAALHEYKLVRIGQKPVAVRILERKLHERALVDDLRDTDKEIAPYPRAKIVWRIVVRHAVVGKREARRKRRVLAVEIVPALEARPRRLVVVLVRPALAERELIVAEGRAGADVPSLAVVAYRRAGQHLLRLASRTGRVEDR